ncbi:TonB-dependent siderophore receptor [Azonexus sp. R2A61]|uniref:TonB-dependent siderophore receptor n=1 Tax=Azonexus sp. R2A61 TaxID=2744443 RepID=UPI001F42A4AC|nr:TonB-dependent siderophore receptor [Azonexus sp. R2A61]
MFPPAPSQAHRPWRQRLLPLACAAALGGPALLPPALAQNTAPATRHAFALDALPLGQALNALARQSGVAISADAARVAGRNAPALHGSMTLHEALQRVLAGSGLVAVPTGSAYTIHPAGTDDGATLAPMTVTAQADRATTENTDSYTTRSMQTATRLPLSIRETPQSVSVITRQRMEDQGLTQLPDIVQQTAGLSMVQSGNAGSDSSPIYSRGFQVENYMVDGIGHLHSNYSSIFQSNDMVLYDRVEIVRGATGLMNGIGTPSATINLIRKKPTAEFQGYVKAETGSWDRYRLEADLSAPLNAAGTLRGRGIVAWQDNDSYIDRLNETKKIVSGIVEADLSSNTLLTAGLTWQRHDATGHSRGGLPLFNSDRTRTQWRRSDSAAASWASSRRENLAAFVSLEHRFANEWKVKGSYSYDRTEYDEQLGYATGGNPNPATGAGVSMYAGRWAGPPVQHSLDVSASGPFTLFGRRHDLVFGSTLSRTKQDAEAYHLWHVLAVPNIYTWDGNTPGKPDNSPVGDFNYKEMTKSAYLTARFKPFDPLSIIVGARTTTWEDETYNRSYATGATDNVTRKWTNQVTPYAGIVYDLTQQWSLYASYTDIFKPQSNRDPGGNYLDPLLGKAYELGSKAELFDGKLNLAAAVYRIEQDNLAVMIPGVTAPDGSQAYRAEAGTTTRGFEIEVGGQLARHWQASAAFSRNLPQNAQGKLLNTNVPQNALKLFSSYRMPWVGNGLTVGGGLRWQNRTWSDLTVLGSPARVTQESYTLVDLMARYDITKQFSATFNAYNLFDKTYQTSSASAYYGEPRSFRLSLAYRF